MDLPHDHPAVAPFLAFCAAMDPWCWAMIRHFERIEEGSFDIAEHDRFLDQQKQKVETIFGQYCDAGRDAVGVRMQAISMLPGYDPEVATILTTTRSPKFVKITTVNPNVIDVRTNKPIGPKSQHRFTLIEQSGRWLIRGKESTDNEGRTWRKAAL